MANLGTLTLDLVAKIGGFTGPLDKAGRESKKFSKAISDGFDTIKTGAAIASAAVVASLTAMTVATVQSAGEIQRFAALAGTSNEQFQKYAAAAKVVGIETDKLSDIFKDVNDKVGDFLQTGGGELKDFFTKIAPQIGVTADQFRNLSGPDALMLFVDTLEKAGASQKDFTFYLESIANDATLLLPLLKNNAEGFRLLGEAAESAGGIMSDKTISAASQLNGAMWMIQQSSKGASNQIVDGMLPALAGVAGAFGEATTSGGIFAKTGTTIGSVITGTAAVAIRAAAAVYNLGSSIGAIAAAAAALLSGELKQAKFIIDEVGRENKKTTDEARAAVEKLYDGTGKGAEQIKMISSFMDEAKRSAKGLGAQITSNSAAVAAGTAEYKSQAAAIKELESAVKDWGFGFLGQGDSSALSLTAPKTTAPAFSLTGAPETMGFGGNPTSDSEAEALAASLMEQEQIQAEHYAALAAMRADFNAGASEALANYLESSANYAAIANDLVTSQLESMESGLGDAISSMVMESQTLGEAFSTLAKGMATSMINALSDIAAKWIMTQIMQMMFGKATQASAATALTANAQATALQAGLAAFASTAAIPIVGPAAAPAAMAAALGIAQPMAASVSAAAFAGMAHDGIDSVPREGTWLLDKGERVTTAETSAKLDRTLDNVQKSQGGGAPVVNLYEDKSRAGTVNSRNEDGRNIIDIFVADLMGDGRTQKAMSRKFGVQPVGA